MDLSRLKLEARSDLSLAGQLRSQIALLIADGELRPGDPLPAVRVLEATEGVPGERTLWLDGSGDTVADSLEGPFGPMTTCESTREAALAAQQGGSPPAEMYARPATVFAARFVGTPPMNLLRLDAAPGRLIGVRPEDVRLGDSGLAARVTAVEYLGPDTIVTCAVGADTLAVRAAGRVDLAEGKLTHLTWAPAAQHVFDAATGERLAG